MLTSQDELKAQLLAKAEAAIEALLKDERLHAGRTLSAIEQVVGPPEAAFRQAAREEIIALHQPNAGACRRWGALENRGKRPTQVVTRRGEPVVERTYYRCQTCGRGYFPPR